MPETKDGLEKNINDMITSPANEKIKNIIQLSTSAKARRDQNAFIVEGIKMYTEAPPKRVREVFISEDLLDKANIAARYDDKNPGADLLKKCRRRLDQTGYTEVSNKVFKKMAETVTPQGIICVVERKTYDINDLTRVGDDMSLKVLILEEIQDPGNLGTMIRTAEAAGIDFVLASEGTVDVYNPKVTRATMGSVFRVPIVYTKQLKDDVELLKKVGVRVYAAHLKGRTAYDKVKYGNRTAIMIGNEGSGLSEHTAALADEFIRIPMKGLVESLNASVAAALCMFKI